ncbi:DUF3943 domain-containing protein [Corallococcus sp. Z5C101001]|uniref:DUF3943 domain-containing protein n=2 Tax=Corallococcus TaxID=83461 RepID=UPI002107FD4A|nr:DUF3943 domain-containing protein [Corallococcus sp. Z5C101001]
MGEVMERGAHRPQQGGGRCPWAPCVLLLLTLPWGAALAQAPAWSLPAALAPLAQDAPLPADAPQREEEPEEELDEDTHPRHHPWRALAEVTAVNLALWTYDRTIGGKVWARVDLHTWKNNLRTGFVWDGDGFSENQFAHPYNGSFYYAAARDNGFSYAASVPFTLLGSLQWELFGEVFPPSINDLINTTLGGSAMGEAFYRLSSMVLDTEATGRKRFFHELGAGALSPVRGVNRLLRGDVSRHHPTPRDWTPTYFASWGTLGYLRLDDGGSLAGGKNQYFAEFSLRYGDAFRGAYRRPFDAFEARAQFTTQEHNLVSYARLQGLLTATSLAQGERDGLRLGLFQQLSYVDTFAYELGGQSVAVGPLYLHQLPGDSTLRSALLLDGLILIGISSEHSGTEGRNYDYCSGGGFQFQVAYARGAWDIVSLELGLSHLIVVDGSSGSHQVRTAQFQLDLPIHRWLGLGVEANYFQRHSRFSAFPDVTKDTYQLRFFMSVH